jgi:hypothetical protein
VPYLNLTTAIQLEPATRAVITAQCGDLPVIDDWPARWSGYRLKVTNESLAFVDAVNAFSNALFRAVTIQSITDPGGRRAAAGQRWLHCDASGQWTRLAEPTAPTTLSLTSSREVSAMVEREGYLVLVCTGPPGGGPDGFVCTGGQRGCQCELPPGATHADLGDPDGTRFIAGAAVGVTALAFLSQWASEPLAFTKVALGARVGSLVFYVLSALGYILFLVSNSILLHRDLRTDTTRGSAVLPAVGVALCAISVIGALVQLGWATVGPGGRNREYAEVSQSVGSGSGAKSRRSKRAGCYRVCIPVSVALQPICVGALIAVDTAAQRPSVSIVATGSVLGAFAVCVFVVYSLLRLVKTEADLARRRTSLRVVNVLCILATISYVLALVVVPCSGIR